MSARVSCKCGAITGLYFDQVMVDRVEGDQVFTEYHYAAEGSYVSPSTCAFYLNGLQVAADRLQNFMVNSAPATVQEYAENLERACSALEKFLEPDAAESPASP